MRKPMNRFSAAFAHFLGSACVVAGVFLLVRLIWYPGRLFEAASGLNLMAILIAVDIILGPLITLIIYKPGKPSLKSDIITVVLLQIAFLMYGVWSIYLARPVYIPFDEDRFFLVTANEIDPEDQRKAADPQFLSQPLLGPEIVGTVLPDDPGTREKIRVGATLGLGVWLLPQYFVSYEKAVGGIKSAARNANALQGEAGVSPDDIARLSAYEKRKRAEGVNVRFVRLATRKVMLFVAIEEASGTVVEIL